MTDTERLDAIGEYGLCVATSDILQNGHWERTWVCQYGTDKIVMAEDIRDAIDLAVLDLTTGEQSIN